MESPRPLTWAEFEGISREVNRLSIENVQLRQRIALARLVTVRAMGYELKGRHADMPHELRTLL